MGEIKTINLREGGSIGGIKVISLDELGAGGGSDVFVAEYGVTTFAEIAAAGVAGKICVCHYNGADYVLSRTESSYVMFGAAYDNYIKILKVTSANVWSSDMNGMQYLSYRKSSWSATPSDLNYPSEKLVYDSLGKKGVISQTQTWTQAADGGWDYTLTNQVYGIIPQSFIDLVTRCSYPGVVVFDEATGYFQMNGLTNISQSEMAQIYSEKAALTFAKAVDMYQFLNITATSAQRTQSLRTLFPVLSSAAVVIGSDYMKYLSEVEVLAFAPINISPSTYNFCYWGNVANIARAFYNNCKALRKIVTPLRCQGSTTFANTTFSGCPSLEEVYVQSLKSNIWLTNSSRLTLASVVYMVENAINTSAITITLHATAYARCQADTTEYTYGGQTYTGILALATAHNISIASA